MRGTFSVGFAGDHDTTQLHEAKVIPFSIPSGSDPIYPPSPFHPLTLISESCIMHRLRGLAAVLPVRRLRQARRTPPASQQSRAEVCVCGAMTTRPGSFCLSSSPFPRRRGWRNAERWGREPPKEEGREGGKEREKGEKKMTKMTICGATAAESLSHRQSAAEIPPRRKEKKKRQARRAEPKWTLNFLYESLYACPTNLQRIIYLDFCCTSGCQATSTQQALTTSYHEIVGRKQTAVMSMQNRKHTITMT